MRVPAATGVESPAAARGVLPGQLERLGPDRFGKWVRPGNRSVGCLYTHPSGLSAGRCIT